MTTLDRALALTEVHDVAVGVAEDLDLDMTAGRHVALEEDRLVTETAERLALGGLHGVGEIVGRFDDAHALAATAGRGLHEQRVTDRASMVGASARILRRWQCRNAGPTATACRDLVAHRFDDVGRRADPADACLGDGSGKGGVLRQEAIARMDGLGVRLLGGGEDGLGVEIGTGQSDGLVGLLDERGVGISIGEHGDAAHAHRSGGTKTRRAISPRLATSTLRIGVGAMECSQSKHPVPLGALDRAIAHDAQTHTQDVSGVSRIDDAVVADRTGGSQRQRTLVVSGLVAGDDLRVGFLIELDALAFGLTPADLGHHAGDLLRTHHGDLRRGPQEREPIAEGRPDMP